MCKAGRALENLGNPLTMPYTCASLPRRRATSVKSVLTAPHARVMVLVTRTLSRTHAHQRYGRG